jgi:hypothetical protein
MEVVESQTCLIGWKLRSGLGRFYRQNAWEQRVFVVEGSSLQYYEIGEQHMNGIVRGSLDLVENQVEVNVASQKTPDAPSQHEVDVSFQNATPPDAAAAGGGHGHGRHGHHTGPPARQHWKFCFQKQEDLMAFLEAVHECLDKVGQLAEKDRGRFEHDFHAGDHIFRWEMIVMPPVIYPIQIHGIVLDAGRNCVVVADFGLTGYSRKQGEDFNHADDHKHANLMMHAWRKLRPNQDQRLNIATLTEPSELRKWYRANYEDPLFDPSKMKSNENLKKITTFMSKLGKLRNAASRSNSSGVDIGDDSSHRSIDDDSAQQQNSLTEAVSGEENTNSAGSPPAAAQAKVSNLMNKLKQSLSKEAAPPVGDDGAAEQQSSGGGGGGWGLPTLPGRSRTNTEDASDTAPATAARSRANTQDDSSQQPAEKEKDKQELPRSDPVEIVLARANFVLEHENVLPPYHVFYSNSGKPYIHRVK